MIGFRSKLVCEVAVGELKAFEPVAHGCNYGVASTSQLLEQGRQRCLHLKPDHLQVHLEGNCSREQVSYQILDFIGSGTLGPWDDKGAKITEG